MAWLAGEFSRLPGQAEILCEDAIEKPQKAIALGGVRLDKVGIG